MGTVDHSTARPHARGLARSASRVHAALTVLAFLLSSLAGVVHEATTRHVACAEHGEQIDSEAATPAIGASAAATSSADHAVRSQPGTALHGHEHCLMVSATRASRLAPCAPALAATVVASADLPGAVTASASARHDTVYRTAPKTSPPV